MKTHILTIIALSASIFSSCSKATDPLTGENEIVIIPSLEESRANLIPAGNLSKSRIHIDGYIHDTSTKHLDANLLYEDSTHTWQFYTDLILGVHYYWPQNSNLDLFAYSPVKLDGTFVTITSSKTFTCNDLPMADSLQKGNLLKEFVCGYESNRSEDQGAIKMTLKRPYAIVDFFLDDAVRSTLNYIKIEGIYNTGDYDASTETWSNLSNKTDLFCKFGKHFPTEINIGRLTDSLIVIPQDLRKDALDKVKLVFSYKSDGNTGSTITESTLGQVSGDSGQVTEWKPGKVYHYYVSLNGAANEARMTVEIRDWSIQGTEEIDVK